MNHCENCSLDNIIAKAGEGSMVAIPEECIDCYETNRIGKVYFPKKEVMMPYIKQTQRDVIGPPDMCGVDTFGDLNYKITRLIHEYIKARGLSYSTLNGVIGVLECAKLELYRQVVAKYEDKKRLENGSVSELDSITLNDVM